MISACITNFWGGGSWKFLQSYEGYENFTIFRGTLKISAILGGAPEILASLKNWIQLLSKSNFFVRNLHYDTNNDMFQDCFQSHVCHNSILCVYMYLLGSQKCVGMTSYQHPWITAPNKRSDLLGVAISVLGGELEIQSCLGWRKLSSGLRGNACRSLPGVW